jgi:hypothetical protein
MVSAPFLVPGQVPPRLAVRLARQERLPPKGLSRKRIAARPPPGIRPGQQPGPIGWTSSRRTQGWPGLRRYSAMGTIAMSLQCRCSAHIGERFTNSPSMLVWLPAVLPVHEQSQCQGTAQYQFNDQQCSFHSAPPFGLWIYNCTGCRSTPGFRPYPGRKAVANR